MTGADDRMRVRIAIPAILQQLAQALAPWLNGHSKG
jgi:hypothetical protein